MDLGLTFLANREKDKALSDANEAQIMYYREKTRSLHGKSMGFIAEVDLDITTSPGVVNMNIGGKIGGRYFSAEQPSQPCRK